VTIHNDVLITAACIADNPAADEQTIVESMVAQGYEILRAEVLVVFVPLGLARAVIARLEANPPIQLPDTAWIRDYSRNRTIEIALSDVPEFMTACEIGEETFQTGIIPREQFKAASGYSVELHLVSDILSAGESLDGGKLFPSILLRLADAPGFEEWYQAIKPKVWKQFLWWLRRRTRYRKAEASLSTYFK
jgi:hypothetical protein